MRIKFSAMIEDKYTGRMYRPGEIVEFDDARGKELLECRYCGLVPEPKKAPAAAGSAAPAQQKKQDAAETQQEPSPAPKKTAAKSEKKAAKKAK